MIPSKRNQIKIAPIPLACWLLASQADRSAYNTVYRLLRPDYLIGILNCRNLI
jgi:hypothetical protein